MMIVGPVQVPAGATLRNKCLEIIIN
jgi:hypothetical protein